MFQYQTSFAFYVHDMYYFTAQILKTCGVKMSDKWILKQLFYCPKSLANLTYKSLDDIFY